MWSAKIEKVEKIGRQARALVSFNHPTESNFTEYVSFSTLSLLKAALNGRLNELATLYAEADSVTLGAIDTTITPPTQAEIDKAQFFVDYSRWLQVKKAIDVGVLTGSETQAVALLNKVKADFKPAYIN